MKPEMTDFQAFAASLAVEGEVCDLPNAKLWMQAADAEMAPLIQKLGAISTAEIERLIEELQGAKEHLQSERERIERETLRYASLMETASTTAKIISDAVSRWRPACQPAEIEHAQSHAGFNLGLLRGELPLATPRVADEG